MRGVSVFVLLGFYSAWAVPQFLNNKPFPTYSLENMPDTAFSCRDKILGGYYADADAECQMFHVCVKVAGVGVQDFRFLCPNGTAFDQDHQICADWEDVDCDATTLYYSSDNFDLYRIGSGFEAKAKKYGEDEETFALQRAETGDVRINKEHQAQRINQHKEVNYYAKKSRKNDNERDIFKGSSSSNYFNNRNGGKENDDDYDDNVNINQDNDTAQKRKLANKKPQRRPQPQETTQAPSTSAPVKRIKQNQNNQQRNYEENPTPRTQKPTGFINNFAGSSYVPTTTSKSTTSLSNDRYTVAVNNHRLRNSQRHRTLPERYNNADNFRQSQATSEPLTVSTPAPFRQTQFNNAPSKQNNYNNYNNQQTYQTTAPGFNKITTQNYPKVNNNQYNNKYGEDFELKKTTKQAEKKTPSGFQNQNDNYPTTFSPKFQKQYYQTTTKKFENYPTTFSPKSNQAYNAISQVTTQYSTNGQNQNKPFNNAQPFTNTKPSYNSPPPQPFTSPNSNNNNNQFNAPRNNFNQQSTPKSTPFTQYTPTVPKITSTTPVARSNRYDETQYDDGSYNSKYDYDDRREDEFLKTAHSQNIAKSRNDLSQQRAQEQAKQSNNKAYYESPRPFSVSPNTPKQQEYTKTTQNITPRYSQNQQQQNKQPQQNQQQQQNRQQQQNKQQQQQKNQPPAPTTTKAPKKVKDVSYDYAYYDTNVGSEPEYEIDTEIKKSTVKN